MRNKQFVMILAIAEITKFPDIIELKPANISDEPSVLL